MSGCGCTSQVALAVDHVSSTLVFAARPEPEIVIGVPATPWSGVTLRTPMVALGWAGFATGPGSAGTPGIRGDCRVV